MPLNLGPNSFAPHSFLCFALIPKNLLVAGYPANRMMLRNRLNRSFRPSSFAPHSLLWFAIYM